MTKNLRRALSTYRARIVADLFAAAGRNVGFPKMRAALLDRAYAAKRAPLATFATEYLRARAAEIASEPKRCQMARFGAVRTANRLSQTRVDAIGLTITADSFEMMGENHAQKYIGPRVRLVVFPGAPFGQFESAWGPQEIAF